MTGAKTTIAISRDTVQRLGDLGQFGESYEDVVVRLIEKVTNKEPGEES